MSEVTSDERAILDWLAGQRGAMIALLEDLVNIDSGTYDKAGVDKVGARLRDFFSQHGIATDVIPSDDFGDAIRAPVGVENGKSIVLMGHRDTVFPKGEAGRRPFKIEGDRAYGPGVADMKAGLVMNAFVLAAFAKFGGQPAPLVGLITSDEEIGSPFSRKVIEAEARKARAVFNAEPGRASGAVVTGRKGGVFMRFEVTGRAAHSGANYEQGISAIEEIARKIVKLHKVTDIPKGITVNVGIVAGGQTVNTVAPSARGEIDLRFITPADREAAMAKIEDIIATADLPGTSAVLTISGEFLPLVESEEGRKLYEHYAAAARDVGIEVPGEFTGGCADSGFTAAVGAPTLCATGPVGGRAHSADEYMEVETLVPRAQSVALAVRRLK